jgi:hypothetical protein
VTDEAMDVAAVHIHSPAPATLAGDEDVGPQEGSEAKKGSAGVLSAIFESGVWLNVKSR